MDYKDLNKLKQMVLDFKKGTIRTVEYTKDLKTPKGSTDKVTKETVLNARFGVQYDNIKDVQSQREEGILPEENQGLPWGHWSQFPYFISHKDSEYIRLSLVNGTKIKSKYFVNGQEVDKATAQSRCLASEFKSNDKPVEILTIKVENIKAIR